MKWVLPVVLFATLAAIAVAADAKPDEKPKPAQSIAELHGEICVQIRIRGFYAFVSQP
jgi:hypothetical protein